MKLTLVSVRMNGIIRSAFVNLSYNGMPYNVLKSFLYDICAFNKNKIILIELTSLFNNNKDNNYVYYASNSTYIDREYNSTLYSILPLLKYEGLFF